MSLFRSRRFHPEPALAAPKLEPLSEAVAIKLAREAQVQDDWPAALVALERVVEKKESGRDYRELCDWAWKRAGRKEKGSAWSKLKLDGHPFGLSPEAALALTHLLHQIKPLSIFEVGSRGGGCARWMQVQCRGMGLRTQIHSADWGRAADDEDNVHFWSGDLRKPSAIWPRELLKNMATPCLVLLRSMGGYEVTWPALRLLHKWLRKGAVICLESEPVTTSGKQPGAKRTSADALSRFVARFPVEFEVLPEFEKQFSQDRLPTGLVCFQHTGLDPWDAEAAPSLENVRALMKKADWTAALDLLNAKKASRQPTRGVDYLRALCFLEQTALLAACEATKEELRYFPDHPQAAAMLASLLPRLFPGRPKLGGDDFHELYRVVRAYTMLSEERLYSLYLLTRLICQMDVPGDIVECGVAAGGGSALIAATMTRHTRRPRKLFACDTFEGMPVPTEKDVAYGVDAESSGWGSGTCAAPANSLLEICVKLGVSDAVVPVKGYFKETLPGLKDKLHDGIAFLHMDGDWYESTWDILVNLYERVQMRGYIQVDDYGHWEGCRQAMWDFAKESGIEFNVHAIDGTGVWLQRPDRQPSDLMLLNVGCGGHFHPAWVNMDIAPGDAKVIQHDLAREPLPFEDGICAAVYHSHVLEHIPPDAVPAFIAECRRVLVPGGILRVAVPDLEGIARAYLQQLDSGDLAKHEWMVIELVDQLARHKSGGRMMEYWKQNPMPAEAFVFQRLGNEARQFVERWRANPVASSPPSSDAADVGRFRMGGEVHLWMYDRLSLAQLLREADFTDIRVCAATESAIAGFAAYELDADLAGVVRKPDSLYMEARKPVASA